MPPRSTGELRSVAQPLRGRSVAFELGGSLRNAREAQGLTFEEIARAMFIRPQLLAALENERFDRLPGGAYSRSFLREYAEPRGPAAPLVRVPVHSHRLRTVAVALLTAAGFATAILAWRFGEERHPA